MSFNEGSIWQTRGLYRTPGNALISGSTGTGKTVLLAKIISNMHQIFDTEIDHVLFCYKMKQPQYEPILNNPKITFFNGLPTEKTLRDMNQTHPGQKLCIFDDLTIELLPKDNIDFVEQLFTVFTHHLKFSVIMLVQIFFTKHLRHISLNVHYIILTKCARDSSQILTLARQVFPGKTKAFLEVYDDAMKSSSILGNRPYIVIDCHPESTNMRIFTNIFKQEYPMIGYVI